MEQRIASVSEALATLRLAQAEDITAALCALDGVTKSFAASLDDLTHRAGILEESATEIERCAPLLRLIEEPPDQGLRIRPIWARAFWVLAALLCVLAAAAGFLTARWHLR